MTWTKIKPYEGTIHQGCLNCPPVQKIADLDMVVAVGFGDAHVSRGDKIIYQENPNDDGDDWHYLQEFEDMALKDPDHDWRLVLFGPLRGREYQRHGPGKWVLIDSNKGFA
jgi:hypothetical protein